MLGGTRSHHCVINLLVTKLVEWIEVARSRAAFQTCLLSPCMCNLQPSGSYIIVSVKMLTDNLLVSFSQQYMEYLLLTHLLSADHWLEVRWDFLVLHEAVKKWDPSWNQRLWDGCTEYWSEVCSPAGPLQSEVKILFRNWMRNWCFDYSQTQDWKISETKSNKKKNLILIYLMTIGDIYSSDMARLHSALWTFSPCRCRAHALCDE